MIQPRFLSLHALLGVALASLLLTPSDGRAGDRQLAIVFVNLTPDAESTPESKKCVQTLRDQTAQEHAELKPMTETPLRKLIGAEDKSASFLEWTSAQTAPATKNVDALFVVDCRPEKQSLDALLVNRTGARVQFRLRGPTLTMARVRWTMDEVLRHAWAGFEL